MEPDCSKTSLGPNKGLAQSPTSLSLTAMPQKPSQSPSTPPTDVTLKPGTEAVLSEHRDTSPMFIKESTLSALGAYKLISLLQACCFSSWQNKNKVCFLWEQEEKNSKLKTLQHRVSYLDSQAGQLQEKRDQLKRASFPYLSRRPSP